MSVSAETKPSTLTNSYERLLDTVSTSAIELAKAIEQQKAGIKASTDGWYNNDTARMLAHHMIKVCREYLLGNEPTAVPVVPADEVIDVLRKRLTELREEVGRHVDPATAEVLWDYAQTLDPYGDDPNLPPEYQQAGREYFARSPGSKCWICFRDLPQATVDALMAKHGRELCFPAGLDLSRKDHEPTIAES